jgi:hypothetical protein
MRGKLRLFFLQTEEFEHPEHIEDVKMREWVENLLQRVRQGYEIVYQHPFDYAHDILERKVPISELGPPASKPLVMPDPLKLPIQ